jgi:hypothetical protein
VKAYHHQPLNPRHKVPGDNPCLGKYDPDQEKHREYLPIHPREERPNYLFPHEFDRIKIREGEMWEQTEWDGKCNGDCCKEAP